MFCMKLRQDVSMNCIKLFFWETFSFAVFGSKVTRYEIFQALWKICNLFV